MDKNDFLVMVLDECPTGVFGRTETASSCHLMICDKPTLDYTMSILRKKEYEVYCDDDFFPVRVRVEI
jgi:hypothetical protein